MTLVMFWKLKHWQVITWPKKEGNIFYASGKYGRRSHRRRVQTLGLLLWQPWPSSPINEAPVDWGSGGNCLGENMGVVRQLWWHRDHGFQRMFSFFASPVLGMGATWNHWPLAMFTFSLLSWEPLPDFPLSCINPFQLACTTCDIHTTAPQVACTTRRGCPMPPRGRVVHGPWVVQHCCAIRCMDSGPVVDVLKSFVQNMWSGSCFSNVAHDKVVWCGTFHFPGVLCIYGYSEV